MNRLIKWITYKLEKLHPGYVETDTPHKRNKRENVLVFLNVLLVVFISVFFISGDLGDTALNREFVINEVQDSNIVTLGSELLNKQSTDELLEQLKKLFGQSFVSAENTSDEILSQVSYIPPEKLYIAGVITSTLTELEEQLINQTVAVLNSFYDYFTGETSVINVEFTLVDLQKELKKNLQAAICESPTSELKGATPEQIESYADTLYQENFAHIPEHLNFSKDTSPPYIAIALNQVQQFTTHLPTISTVLLVGIIILMVTIILIQKDIKQSLWTLGATLLITGIVDILYLNIARMILSKADLLSFLPAINMWLIDIVSDVLVTISQPFTLMMIVGGIMLVMSVLWSFVHFKKSDLNTSQ